MNPFDGAGNPPADFHLNPYRSDSLRRHIASLPCSACGWSGSTEIVNDAWSDAHAFPLCASCRQRFDRITDKNEQRNFANEQNLKALRQIVELYVGRLPALKEE